MPENKLKFDNYKWPVMRLAGASSVMLPEQAQLGLKNI